MQTDIRATRLPARQVFRICTKTVGGPIGAAVFVLAGAWLAGSDDLDEFGIGLSIAAMVVSLVRLRSG